MKRTTLIKLLISALILSSLFVTTATAGGTKTHSNYTVIFNSETGNGIVYKNGANSSCLFVLYPSANQVYSYNKSGGQMMPYDTFRKLIENTVTIEELLEAIVAVIGPVEEEKSNLRFKNPMLKF